MSEFGPRDLSCLCLCLLNWVFSLQPFCTGMGFCQDLLGPTGNSQAFSLCLGQGETVASTHFTHPCVLKSLVSWEKKKKEKKNIEKIEAHVYKNVLNAHYFIQKRWTHPGDALKLRRVEKGGKRLVIWTIHSSIHLSRHSQLLIIGTDAHVTIASVSICLCVHLRNKQHFWLGSDLFQVKDDLS